MGQVAVDGDLLGRPLLDGSRWVTAGGAAALLCAALAWLVVTRRDREAPPSLDRPDPWRPSLLRAAVVAGGSAMAVLPAIAPPGGPLPELVVFGRDLGRSGNTLDPVGAALWLAGIAAATLALAGPNRRVGVRSARSPGLAGSLGLAAVVVVAAWFRLVDLPSLPPDMISDHAEKLLDVRDVLAGFRPVFFAANGGREPLQFYLTAGLVAAGMPLSFGTLKLGMAAVGVATVPAVYWLGREAGGARLGLLAAAVLATMPWHLQVVRLGLRAPLSPLLAALVLASLLRALRTGSRRAWLAAGLLTGLGLYGYTGFRPMLAAAPLAMAVALLVARPGGRALRRAVVNASAAALLTALVALPMARVAVLDPASFWARSLARVSPSGPGEGSPVVSRIVDGWVDTVLMTSWTRDPTWALNPAFRPALDPVGGGLLALGLVAAVAAATRRDWRLAALLATGPPMLAASAMAFGFPGEIPHLARAAGVLPVVAVLGALPLDRLLASADGSRQRIAATGLAAALLAVMAAFSAHRLLVEYRAGYAERCQPVSLGAAVARQWIAAGGAPERVVLVGWPHGWDWRALAFELGEPDWSRVRVGTGPDMEGAVDQVEADRDGTLVLLGRAPDAVALAQRFPGAFVRFHPGHVPGRSFWSAEIPPQS